MKNLSISKDLIEKYMETISDGCNDIRSIHGLLIIIDKYLKNPKDSVYTKKQIKEDLSELIHLLNAKILLAELTETKEISFDLPVFPNYFINPKK